MEATWNARSEAVCDCARLDSGPIAMTAVKSSARAISVRIVFTMTL